MSIAVSRKVTLTVTIAVAIVAALIFLAHVMISATFGPLTNLPKERIVVNQGNPGEAIYEVEVVKGEQLAVGLMNRANAPEPGTGMLFDWEDTGEQSMHMYNTDFPLTAIWLDEDYQVVGSDDMPVCASWRLFWCPTFESPGPVRYTLEVATSN